MSKPKVKVWTCKIIIPDVDTPNGFDLPPRIAAIEAIEAAGIKILLCTSGWGGTLTKGEALWIRQKTFLASRSKDNE